MPFVPVSHASARLGLSERSVYRRIKLGKLKAARDGTRTLVEVPDHFATSDGLTEPVSRPVEPDWRPVENGGEGQNRAAELMTVMSEALARAGEVERRAVGTIRRWVGATATIAIVAVVGGIWHFQGENENIRQAAAVEAEHVETVNRIEVGHAAEVGGLTAARTALESRLTDATTRGDRLGVLARGAVIEGDIARGKVTDLSARLVAAEAQSWDSFASWVAEMPVGTVEVAGTE